MHLTIHILASCVPRKILRSKTRGANYLHLERGIIVHEVYLPFIQYNSPEIERNMLGY